ncbi:actin cytoskeleton-regulatory complex protein PAN1-like [Penaeus japonicus]|uniref:actin cytoskeleton-regulatory complex protein PAN1-like n=1 Tax=Penaeus japonicus TaxID=27405 RepID=UPI001C7112DA|nr:actin cytoskeleton-regulatory complex protein PAN1-like [Penaeus japonicus]
MPSLTNLFVALSVFTAAAAQSLFDGIDFTQGASDAENSPSERTSLFDGIDFTQGASDVGTSSSEGTSLFALNARNEEEQQESLFGGVKMSHSLKALEEKGVPLESLENFSPSRRASLSELQVTSRPRRPPSGRRVASATVSVGLSGAQRSSGSSLFDTVPFGGANHYQDRGFGSGGDVSSRSNGGGQPSLHYDTSDFVASAPQDDYADDYAADYGDTETQPSRFTHRFLLPSDEDDDYETSENDGGDSTSRALQILARSAQQLASALEERQGDARHSTFPHQVQGDFHSVLESLASKNSGSRGTGSEGPDGEEDEDDPPFLTEEDLSKLSKLFGSLEVDSKETTASLGQQQEMDEKQIAEIRRKRLEDLRLALEIIRDFEEPTSGADEGDEEFELMLAKSLFSKKINSLTELNRKQRDSLDSLMESMRSRRSHSLSLDSLSLDVLSLFPFNTLSFAALASADAPSSSLSDTSRYLLPNQNVAPARDPGPPSPPSSITTFNSYLPPNQNTAPLRNPAPPSPPSSITTFNSYLPPNQNTAPLRNPAPPSPPPTLAPVNSYLPPNRNPAPLRDPGPPAPPPSPPVIVPATAFTLQAGQTHSNPSANYLPPQQRPSANPLPPTIIYALPAPVQPQADAGPPAPPPTTTTTTTRRPPQAYLPPFRDEVRPQRTYRPPAASLPLETSSDDSLRDWRPISRPSSHLGYSSDPLDAPGGGRDSRNDSSTSVHNYHYHYHISGSKDELFQTEGKASADKPSNDRIKECQSGIDCSLFEPSHFLTAPNQDSSLSDDSSYTSFDQERPSADRPRPQPPLNPRRPSGGYGPPPSSTPANPPTPMYGYGPPRTTTPANPPAPMYGYGPPRTTTPANPPAPVYGYGPPPVTTPANPLPPPPPPPPPPQVYGPPPTTPATPPSPPPARYGPPPPANPPAPPPTLPPADPSPPSPPPPPPPTPSPQNIYLVPLPKQPKAPLDPFAFLKPKAAKKAKPGQLVAFGPLPVRRLPAQTVQFTNNQQRNPTVNDQTNLLTQQRDQLQRQYLQNEQQLLEQRQQLRDLNQLQMQIRVQEMQREQLKKTLFNQVSKDKFGGEFKKIFYKGAVLLGAMSLIPFAAGRRRRDLEEWDARTSEEHLDRATRLSAFLNQSLAFNLTKSSDNQTDDEVAKILQLAGIGNVTEAGLQELESFFPPPPVMKDPGCLQRSFCSLMAGLEGTEYHHDFLLLYLKMFPAERRSPIVMQALNLAEQRDSEKQTETPEQNDGCQAYSCPVPDNYL